MPYGAVIFDLDGTLLDTLEDLADATNSVLTRLGFPTHPVSAYRRFVGNGAFELVRRVLPAESRDDKTLEKCHRAFLQTYARNRHSKTHPYPGIAALLDRLANEKIKSAVLSNKPHTMAVEIVKTLLAPWRFETVLGQRNGYSPKPDPAGAFEIAQQMKMSVSEFIFVGDSGVDMKTAAAAGMFPVGAAWGFRSEEELRQSGARTIITDPLKICTMFG